MKSKGNSTKFDLVGSSSYPSSSYWGSTVLTIYERAAFTSTEVFKEEEGEAVLTVLPAAEEHDHTEKRELLAICPKCCLLLFSYF